MDQHHGITLSPIDVVQSYAIYFQEAADGRVLVLGIPRSPGIINRGSSEDRGRANQSGTDPRGTNRPVSLLLSRYSIGHCTPSTSFDSRLRLDHALWLSDDDFAVLLTAKIPGH